MTAVQLEALLHYHYKVNRFGEPNPSRSEKDADTWALNNNLISNDGVGNISLTPRGQFLVDHLLDTPLPVAIEAFEINRI